MDLKTRDTGTLIALMVRMKEYRVPRARQLLEKVDGGEKLSDEDISFLKRVYNDSRNSQSLVARHPEYHDLVIRAIELYTEIITKGLENEKAG